MTDAAWAVVRPLLPVPGWLRGRGVQPEAYCHRAILEAIRYLADNGIKWRAMPTDFPPWDRAYAFFRRWRDHALVKEFHDRLRARIREKEGRDAEPTAGVIDSQSVKADAVVGSDSRGFDGGKLINGRKRQALRYGPNRAPGVVGWANGPASTSNNARTGALPSLRRRSRSAFVLGQTIGIPDKPTVSLSQTSR
jgi:transposase